MRILRVTVRGPHTIRSEKKVKKRLRSRWNFQRNETPLRRPFFKFFKASRKRKPEVPGSNQLPESHADYNDHHELSVPPITKIRVIQLGF